MTILEFLKTIFSQDTLENTEIQKPIKSKNKSLIDEDDELLL